MVGVIFNCPGCRMACIHGVTSADDVCSLTNLLPVRLACWHCRRESLVVPRDHAVPSEGIWDTLQAHADRIADACSRRAVVSEDETERRFFLKMEWCWRNAAARSIPHHRLPLVGAAMTGLPMPAIRRSA